MIKFSYTIFYVKDVVATVKFFEEALGIAPKFIHEGNAYAELMTGEVTLAFASEEIGEMNLPGGFQRHSPSMPPQACEVAFTTDDPQKLYDRAIKAGATPISPPTLKPWGQIVGYIRSPEGLLIEICSEHE